MSGIVVRLLGWVMALALLPVARAAPLDAYAHPADDAFVAANLDRWRA